MDYKHGALIALLGGVVYELALLKGYLDKKGAWPWKNNKSPLTWQMYLTSVIVKLVLATVFGGMVVYTKQVSGPWAAFITGMVADLWIGKLGSVGLKEVYGKK